MSFFICLYRIVDSFISKFEDIKGVIRSHKPKDRQCNG